MINWVLHGILQSPHKTKQIRHSRTEKPNTRQPKQQVHLWELRWAGVTKASLQKTKFNRTDLPLSGSIFFHWPEQLFLDLGFGAGQGRTIFLKKQTKNRSSNDVAVDVSKKHDLQTMLWSNIGLTINWKKMFGTMWPANKETTAKRCFQNNSLGLNAHF